MGLLADHPLLSSAIAGSVVVLVVLVGRYFWRRATRLRGELKSRGGGAWPASPGSWWGSRFRRSQTSPRGWGSWLWFLAAFSIPVSFHSVVATGANSISSSLSFTPGGVGVTQALNVAVLESTTSTSNATAYSVAQQLIVSAWDVLFAIALVAWVFGWSGGKQPVRQSYAAAEVKRRELKEQREAKRHADGLGWRMRR
jgi:hypothetical protein